MQRPFDSLIKPEFEQTVTFFRRDPGIVGETHIALMKNGKLEVWEVGYELAKALKGMGRYESNILVKFLSVPSKLLRAGSTLAPDFMVRNFTRDTVTSSIMSERGFIPFVHSTMGFWHMIKQDKMYQEWTKSGGMQSSIMAIDRNYMQKDVGKFLYGGKIRNQISNPMETLRVMSDLLESTSRMGHMKLTHKQLQGADVKPLNRNIREKGGFEGRDYNIDYAKIGATMQGLNMMTSFFNARLQGDVNLYKAFKERPGRTSWQVFKYITLPSMLLWWINHDNPIYLNLPQWQKDLFWIVITPETGLGDKIIKDNNDHTVWSFPKPFTPGWLFGTIPERALSWAYENKGEEFAKSVGDLFTSNLSGLVPIPDFVKPYIESWTNRNLFNNMAIIPYGTEKFGDIGKPEYQFNLYTSETAKLLGATLSKISGGKAGSPARIDSIIKNWTGTLGGYAIQISDAGLKASGVVETHDPDWRLEDLPVIKAFIVRDISGASEYIQRFYEKDKKAQATIELKNKLLKDKAEGTPSIDLEKIFSTLDHSLLMFEGPSDAMAKIRDVIKKTYLNPETPTAQKRQLIDELYEMMIDIARETLANHKDLTATKK